MEIPLKSHSQSRKQLDQVSHGFVQSSYETLIMAISQIVWVTRFSAVMLFV